MKYYCRHCNQTLKRVIPKGRKSKAWMVSYCATVEMYVRIVRRK